ncbi:MAG TPA: aminotransferase class IV, partial [Armatimonadota bacterium]
ECGLLPGIWRAKLLADGRVVERVITADDLLRASSVTVGNSVRGALPVKSILMPNGEEVVFNFSKP